MARRYLEELSEVARRYGATPDGQKVDQLNEQPCSPTAGAAHHLRQLAQAGRKAIMPSAQQRSTRYVTDARGLDDECSRAPAREALVPLQHLRRDDAVLARTPG